jgi:hypothetical protein
MAADLVIDLPHPERMSRLHLLIRLVIAILTGGIFDAIGWPGGFLYLAVPALAALLIAQHGASRYFASDVPILVRILDWIMAFYAYMTLLTDEFPLDQRPVVHTDVSPSGTPTVGSAVFRFVSSIPAMIVLAIYGFIGAIVWLLAVLSIVAFGRYPRSWFDYQCGVLRFAARVIAYHASFVETYPPLTLELGPSAHEPTALTM